MISLIKYKSDQSVTPCSDRQKSQDILDEYCRGLKGSSGCSWGPGAEILEGQMRNGCLNHVDGILIGDATNMVLINRTMAISYI